MGDYIDIHIRLIDVAKASLIAGAGAGFFIGLWAAWVFSAFGGWRWENTKVILFATIFGGVAGLAVGGIVTSVAGLVS